MMSPRSQPLVRRPRWFPAPLVLAFLAAGRPAFGQLYEACGTLVPACGGTLFQPDAPPGALLILQDLGAFQVGDRVHVVGSANPCKTSCPSSHVCLLQNTIDACAPCSCGAYCFGDGTSVPCPCGGVGGALAGCPNSLNGIGADLFATGGASLSYDTIVLTARGLTGAWTLYLQGTASDDVVFGDGKRCVGGSLIRLGTKPNVYSTSKYPYVGEPRISEVGRVGSPGTRHYQAWYRDAAPFCTGASFNLTNAVSIAWGP